MTQSSSERSFISRFLGSRRVHFFFGSVFLLAVCIAARYYSGTQLAVADTSEKAPVRRSTAAVRPAPVESEASEQPAANTKTAKKRPAQTENIEGTTVPPIVATVNTRRILSEDLALECRKRYGKEILESIVNKRLIIVECEQQGVKVTKGEIQAEVERMAKRFNIPVDQWMKMLKQERNITPEQYSNDIIWPTLALRKLAGERLAVTPQELQIEYDVQYGDAVRARLIAVSDLQKAKKLQAKASAKPEDFGNLAKDYSEDAPSASAKGVINPIRKHGSYKEIEDAVFNMADGDVSPVIHAGGQYVILKREGLVPARKVNFEQVAPRLEEVIRDRKMRTVSQDVFRQLQENAKVENVWNDPEKREKMPGVAATLNGSPITIRELDEECIARHGLETLDGMINRKILEEAIQRREIKITKEDINQEIARAALAGVKPKRDGSADVESWLKLVTQKQGIPLDAYRNDVVWPTVALKKLVGDNVKVTDEDLRKGYESNYGPRVRCLAIVLDNQRRAQQVFEMARKNNTAKNFGDLAEQYSVDAASRSMRGEIPPIRKYQGRPVLEDEAFALQAGEVSGVIQVEDRFVILRCEGQTKPAKVDFESVRNDIYEDIHEKKLRLAMASKFEELQEAALVDNYLAGTSHAPKRDGDGASTGGKKLPSLRQVPGGK